MYISKIKVSVVQDGRIKTPRAADEPSKIVDMAQEVIGKDEREHLLVFMLDARMTVKSVYVASIGTVSASLVHPREIYRAAVVSGASAIVVCHNHPSGQTDPSQDDKESTRRLQRAGELLGIPCVDHVIIAQGHDPETCALCMARNAIKKAGGDE